MANYQYKWAVEREMKYSYCAPYMEKPFSELVEPKYVDMDGSSGCYHIYNYRRYHDQKSTPFTNKGLDSSFESNRWADLGAISGVGLVIASLLSGLIYLAGVVFAWVLKGFKGNASSN